MKGVTEKLILLVALMFAVVSMTGCSAMQGARDWAFNDNDSQSYADAKRKVVADEERDADIVTMEAQVAAMKKGKALDEQASSVIVK